jgi:hypothetical protein
MSKPLVDLIPFAKILIGLAILLALSMGLFGLSIALIWSGKSVPPGMDRLMNKAADMTCWQWFYLPRVSWLRRSFGWR